MKQFSVPNIYRSELISAIKQFRKGQDKLKKDFSPTLLNLGDLRIYLARHFGFCYGVENAIEIAFKTIEENKGKKIFLLSEMIHNPQVNEDLISMGINFLQDTYGHQLIPFESLNSQDVVIIPAFGTSLEIESLLRAKGIQTEKYNTTCPFVEKVWNRTEQIAQKGYSAVIHGKPKHEETRATFSHAAAVTPSVVVNDLAESIELGKYITGEKNAADFYQEFEGQYSKGFDINKDLSKIGVVNQTTQLASDTQAISDYLKNIYTQLYQLTPETIAERFADTRDTLCYATNDNQSAVIGMLDTPADLAIVIGGYNSSNSSHLVELCEKQLPTYFIDGPDRILSKEIIEHRNWNTKTLSNVNGYLPNKLPINLLVTAGASCPDAVVEAVIQKIASYFNLEHSLKGMLQHFEKY